MQTDAQTPNHNHQKKLAVINDFCGFGRCSLAVELPIISAMGVQCCPLPTAIFSNHTGYSSFFHTDYTEHFAAYAAEWAKLGLEFAGITTGFLGSAEQISLVKEFLNRFRTPDTQVLVDPVMGDYGRLYPTYTPELAARMVELLPYAHILTPNLTEACILTGTPYREDMGEEELYSLCEALSNQGPERVVISGINQGQRLGNFVYQRGQAPVMLWTEKLGGNRSGTGDVFCAVLAADMVNGVEFSASVEKAARFISTAIQRTVALDIPPTDGLAIEECLLSLAPEARLEESL
ncbi:MAG: pyridoxamine kinase [Oscillospiraceae bacterium]|nr:pyridoxamine kinase [Oscillospiraceae bacterium]